MCFADFWAADLCSRNDSYFLLLWIRNHSHHISHYWQSLPSSKIGRPIRLIYVQMCALGSGVKKHRNRFCRARDLQNITADDNPFLWTIIFSYDYFSQHILRHNYTTCDLPFCHNEIPLQNFVVARGAVKGGSNNFRGSLLTIIGSRWRWGARIPWRRLISRTHHSLNLERIPNSRRTAQRQSGPLMLVSALV